MSYSEAMAKHYQDKASKNKIKVGDVVEFKNYEDMNDNENLSIPKDEFTKSGKVRNIIEDNEKNLFFSIEGSEYGFSVRSVARVISDVDSIDINSLNPGDEVLVKATIDKIQGDYIWIILSTKSDVVDILKRKEPERFIIKEVYYNMYISEGQGLVSDKNKAKVYTSRDAANREAMNMPLIEWEVFPYGD